MGEILGQSPKLNFNRFLVAIFIYFCCALFRNAYCIAFSQENIHAL